MKFIITPCLLGFAVKVQENHNERNIGVIEDFGDVLLLLFQNWNLDFTIELR